MSAAALIRVNTVFKVRVKMLARIPCWHFLLKIKNIYDMAVGSFVSSYSCLYAFVMNQFTEGNINPFPSKGFPIDE